MGLFRRCACGDGDETKYRCRARLSQTMTAPCGAVIAVAIAQRAMPFTGAPSPRTDAPCPAAWW
ncbi:hypothetical protein [Lysobacter gummosus]|uniref:hypothetical protein n=1 Tax=Lysobacter gummosus TaxID=262324 RepID=UPI0036338627